MKIKEYFALYEKLKTNKANPSLKQFCFLDKRTSLIKYLKNKKSFIIKNINYSFFSSDEPYLLSVFADGDINFIHINIKKLPPNFDSLQEYENYLAIYGTFAVLIKQSFQIEDLNDIIFYISNALKIDRTYNQKIKGDIFNIEANSDLVLTGLGFIKFKKKCQIVVSSKYNIKIYTRKSLM